MASNLRYKKTADSQWGTDFPRTSRIHAANQLASRSVARRCLGGMHRPRSADGSLGTSEAKRVNQVRPVHFLSFSFFLSFGGTRSAASNHKSQEEQKRVEEELRDRSDIKFPIASKFPISNVPEPSLAVEKVPKSLVFLQWNWISVE